jgi:hypothetical protein
VLEIVTTANQDPLLCEWELGRVNTGLRGCRDCIAHCVALPVRLLFTSLSGPIHDRPSPGAKEQWVVNGGVEDVLLGRVTRINVTLRYVGPRETRLIFGTLSPCPPPTSTERLAHNPEIDDLKLRALADTTPQPTSRSSASTSGSTPSTSSTRTSSRT